MSADPLGFTGRVLCAGNTVAILYQAHKQLAAGTPMPTLMADDGVENFNAAPRDGRRDEDSSGKCESV